VYLRARVHSYLLHVSTKFRIENLIRAVVVVVMVVVVVVGNGGGNVGHN
jgi:hypothetical protein